jgi:hypothetical protein
VTRSVIVRTALRVSVHRAVRVDVRVLVAEFVASSAFDIVTPVVALVDKRSAETVIDSTSVIVTLLDATDETVWVVVLLSVLLVSPSGTASLFATLAMIGWATG